MSVFGKYSSYYNLLYKDKDYAAEAEYVHRLIQRHCPGAKSVMDLGCGTGKHDFALAERGCSVTGVDISEEMLAIANAQNRIEVKNKKSNSTSFSILSFTHGDIRKVRLGKTFDVVVSLFHVMSYQTTNEDLDAVFKTAKAHLKPGGIFLFDCWYGPAVLTDRPSIRVKRLEDDAISVVRIAEPVMYPNENCVDVRYSVFIRDKSNCVVEELNESHRMRYLFKPEIDVLFKHNNFEMIQCEEWMTGMEPGFDSWGVCFVGRTAHI